MRSSDWSSDVCSSDLARARRRDPRRPHSARPQGDARSGWRRHDMGCGAAHLLRGIRLLRGLRLKRDISAGARLTRDRSEEHTSELQSLMRISYAVFCLKKKNKFQLPLIIPIIIMI